MQHESRKRPHADNIDDFSSSKKRTMDNSSPQLNGVHHNSDEPTFDNLEQFRKEAIYRRMLSYSRENERYQIRIAELERRKNTCEASYAAIVACWTQLVETIRLLIKPEDLPQVRIDSQALLDLNKSLTGDSSGELASALEKEANATRTLVGSFLHLSNKSHTRLFDNSHFLESYKATTAVAVLQSEIATLRSKLQESEDEREHIRIQLTVAENRFERTRSKTVQALEARKAKSEGTEELEQKPSSPSQPVTPPPQTLTNGDHDMYDFAALEEQVKCREARIVELDRQVATLRDQNAILEAEFRMKEVGDHIYDHAAYKDVVQFALKLDADLGEKYKMLGVLQEEVQRLTEEKEKYNSELITAAEKQLQELRAMLQKRDAENARLREQRDQQAAELVERRHKDAVKTSSLEQLKLLVDSRSERIAQLEIDLNQCKAHIAANIGNKQLLLTYLHGEDSSRQHWEILEEQLRQAQQQVTAMQQTISSYDEDTQHAMHKHVEMSQRVVALTEELERYRIFLGPNTSPNLAELSRLLKEKEDEVQKHKLLELQRTEAERSLYLELEKITSAWETLDRQIKNKVFDLTSLEERLSKSQMDKARSDNRYYAAVREKEALENEKKNKERLFEKQQMAVETLHGVQKNLTAQVQSLTSENAAQRKQMDTLNLNLLAREKARSELVSRVEMDRGRYEALRHKHKDFEKGWAEQKKQELRQIEDGLIKARKEVERQAARMKEAVTTTPGSSDIENLKSILKCSTCRINFRSTAITKCMHTFCKECVEKRIQTRQRKCPACNIAFAQSEVQQIWFQ
ncbi:E3 ubiquitin-protein ligase bre1 [Leucoagaricus gongylophorus]